jgi:hypothetical protein
MSFLTRETGLQRVVASFVYASIPSQLIESPASKAGFWSDSINPHQAPSIATKQDFLTVNFSDACCHPDEKQQIAWLGNY